MSTPEFRNEAQWHLDKARRLLSSAESEAMVDFHLDGAGSNAALAAIHAKDAIAILVNDKTIKSNNHEKASKELEEALKYNPEQAAATTAFDHALNAKNTVQYSNKAPQRELVTKRIEDARYLVDLAAGELAQS
jgi:hypothetical protein